MAPKTGKSKGDKKSNKLAKWYPADDERVRLVRRQKQNKTKTATLRQSITPGSVLILLAGRFRGKRVVFLKQLKSGLLLVTGPYKLNGVPLKRVNQIYVQPTSTKVDVKGVKVDNIEDNYFAKTKGKGLKKNEQGLFARQRELTEQQKKEEENRKSEKKQSQSTVDASLLSQVKSVPYLAKYLGARFTITNAFRPHEARF